VLYVRSDRVDHRAIVDAFSAAFNVEGQRKPSLLQVLDARSAADAEEALDWQGLPPLPDEFHYETASAELALEFDETAPPPQEPVDEPERQPHADPSATTDQPATSEQSQVPRANTDAPPPPPAAPDTPFTRAQSPRGVTDIEALQRYGIRTVDDLDEEADEVDYDPPVAGHVPRERDEARLCLSFYDVRFGMLPITQPDALRLTSGIPVSHVRLFGDEVPARQLSRHIELDDGAMIFASRNVVPGTVVRLLPGPQGAVEAVLREDRHRVDGVWMLELDDEGTLLRFKQDDLELTWETDDAFYRAERRLEDLEALSKDGGKSAVQLVIEVFHARPGEGLTADEVWGLVAVSRLFAKSTISHILVEQTGLFEKRDGLWYKVGDELRRRRTLNTPPARTGTRAATNQGQEAVRTARKLVTLVSGADQSTRRQVNTILNAAGLGATDAGAGTT
jgi:hypothetical protein